MTYDDGFWDVDGEDRTTIEGWVMLDPSELPLITADDLARELEAGKLGSDNPAFAQAAIYEGPEGHLDADESPRTPTSFVLREGRLCVEVDLLLGWPPPTGPDELEDFAGQLEKARAVATPFLQHRGSRILELTEHWPLEAPFGRFLATMVLTAPQTATRLDQLAAIGDGLVRLLEAMVGGEASRDTLADLIRGGHAGLLVGLPEGNGLDAKSQEWDLESDDGKHKLAVEVSAFCNAEEGGIIVFGVSTETPVKGGGEVITEVGGLHKVRTPPRGYEKAVDARVYPFPLGLRVDVIELDNHHPIVMIDIPAQPEELKPFLVKGAISYDGAKVDGKAFTVAQRRGEDTQRLEASMLHAQLAVGRRFLRNLPIDGVDGPGWGGTTPPPPSVRPDPQQ